MRNAERADAGPVLAADGTPLKKSLNRALRLSKLRALMLIAPLLIFVVVTFIAPIADMLFRSVENNIVADTLPRTIAALDDWDETTGNPPDNATFEALYKDMYRAVEAKAHTRLGSRLNYELTGMSSLFRKSGRKVEDMGEVFQDQFEDLDGFWKDGENWNALMGTDSWLAAMEGWDTSDKKGQPPFEMRDGLAAMLPQTATAFQDYAQFIQRVDEKNLARQDPWALVYSALYNDLTSGADVSGYTGPAVAELQAAAAAVDGFETVDYRAAFVDIDEDWADPEVWKTVRLYGPNLTNGYFLNAVDMQKTPQGVEMRPENQQIYITLFWRTLVMSLAITGMCILLGYPVAWLLANLPARSANLLMILVLLPFWTSLLVRTSAWKVMLQQQGVVNDTLVWYHSTAVGKILDPVVTLLMNVVIGALNAVVWIWNLLSGIWGAVDVELFTYAALGFERLALINNVTGTIIAMTHILLPFMILPLYSVMATIPPVYLRAAKSMGATNWTAFWRVYFPQSVPGIGAGSILVFILAIGYYITPEIVGGTKGVFISNRIAYHISSSLNWGLAAALGSILLAAVLLLYWAYDRIVGIDNVKLGG
ncbi:ABC transporter permease [Sulfitobacter sp. TSTF-M16]|uniref:ABC transporter permease n=1 Tax=Sulfitobacter aestuariivivens TaxID=2766981 RepID=A0A927HF78_9RHOB|nr:ABC transporter permease [Sulfitobacter aestuariivivens]